MSLLLQAYIFRVPVEAAPIARDERGVGRTTHPSFAPAFLVLALLVALPFVSTFRLTSAGTLLAALHCRPWCRWCNRVAPAIDGEELLPTWLACHSNNAMVQRKFVLCLINIR